MSRSYKVRYYARSRKAGRYMNENRGLWRAKRLDTGEWVEGYYVFEGDILKHQSGTLHEIVFEQRNGKAYFGWKISEIDTWDFDLELLRQLEVVGNIHDNPELLRRATGEDIGNAAQDTIAPAT